VVNNDDIAAFVAGLTDPAVFLRDFAYRPDVFGDVNLDGSFNNDDIAAFVAPLTGGRSRVVTPPPVKPRVVDSPDKPDRLAASVL
jgi:hypothetical protein